MQTAIKKVRVECSDLAVGMYVCELDKPWLDSPFLLQGFYIKDENDIDTVRGICSYVYVDKLVEREKLDNSLPGASSAVMMTRTVSKDAPGKARGHLSRAATAGVSRQPQKQEQALIDFFPGKELTKYTDTVSWRDETRNAKRAISYLYEYIVKFMELSSKSDRIDLQNVSKAVEPMVKSVIQNPDAALWWTTMKPPANDNNDAALRASVFSVVLGRQLGLPKRDLFALAIGGLLFDIGKLRMDDSILQADRKLTEEELAHIKRHVEVGLDLLQRNGLRNKDIVNFVANHHERLDGSGYPQGVVGDNIPAFGRIAGLVDCYNAITSSRRYAATRSPAEAINQLYKLKGVHFHKDLIEEFIQAIGVYPVGAMVELSSGEVAIVVAQSRTRRLRPIVLVLLDANKGPCPGGNYITLEEVTHSADGNKLDIVKNLEPNAYDIDMAAIKLQ